MNPEINSRFLFYFLYKDNKETYLLKELIHAYVIFKKKSFIWILDKGVFGSVSFIPQASKLNEIFILFLYQRKRYIFVSF